MSRHFVLPALKTSGAFVLPGCINIEKLLSASDAKELSLEEFTPLTPLRCLLTNKSFSDVAEAVEDAFNRHHEDHIQTRSPWDHEVRHAYYSVAGTVLGQMMFEAMRQHFGQLVKRPGVPRTPGTATVQPHVTAAFVSVSAAYSSSSAWTSTSYWTQASSYSTSYSSTNYDYQSTSSSAYSSTYDDGYQSTCSSSAQTGSMMMMTTQTNACGQLPQQGPAARQARLGSIYLTPSVLLTISDFVFRQVMSPASTVSAAVA